MYIKNRLLKNAAAVVALLFIFTSCALPGFLGGAPGGRRTVAFEKMEYTRPDGAAIISGADALIQQAKDAKNYNQLMKLDAKFGQLILPVYTAYTLAELKTYLDITDTYFEEEYRYCDDLYVEVMNKVSDFSRVIIEGPFAEEYRRDVGDYYFQQQKNQLLLNSEEVAPLKKQRNTINTDYTKDFNQMEFTYQNKLISYDDIWEIADSNEAFYRLLRECYKQNAQKFTSYYSQIVALDKEMAYKLGFASAADYYYLSYSRDYTPADALQYGQHAKEIFAPLYQTQAPRTVYIDKETSFNSMPSVLESMDKSLLEAWNFMLKYNLHSFDASENKNPNVAFQTELYGYDAPFIYGYWDDTTTSLATLSHEFGHFYDAWLGYSRQEFSVFNLDVAESYSQGLELLVSFKFDAFTSSHKRAQQSLLYDFLNPLVWQIAIEEFTQKVYQLNTFDPDLIAKLYADVMLEYGIESPFVDENGRDYSWYRISHIFDAPFYTVSYWTSASVALQIWSAAKADYNSGLALYLGMINAPQNQPFKALVTGAGLQDPGNVETMRQIAKDVAAELGLDYRDYPALAA